MLDKKKILTEISKSITELRLHGRGGQGVVMASKILSKAFYSEGFTPQTFPKYGVERRGAPAAAFVRVWKNKRLIGIRSEIYEPDHIVVLDHTLISAINVTDGLKKGGWIIINGYSNDKTLYAELLKNFRVAVVDASRIAFENRLGSKTSPVVNSAILGGFSKIYKRPSIQSIINAIKEEVPVKPEENANAAQMAYDEIAVIGEN